LVLWLSIFKHSVNLDHQKTTSNLFFFTGNFTDLSFQSRQRERSVAGLTNLDYVALLAAAHPMATLLALVVGE
jgi:hypothetical protein